MLEEEKCFAGQLSKKKKVSDSLFPHSERTQGPPLVVTVLGPADSLALTGGRPAASWTMVGRQGSL